MAQSSELPPHGEDRRYMRGCRCVFCRHAHSMARKVWGYETHNGRVFKVDATPAREHALSLVAQNMGTTAIARAAGLSSARVHTILYGRKKAGTPPPPRINPADAEALLRVKHDPLAVGSRVRPDIVQRQLQALAWLGFGKADVAGETGLSANTLAHIAGESQPITRATHEKIGVVYSRLKNEPATDNQVHRHAVQKNWAPPWAWGQRIEDLAARPDLAIPPPAHLGPTPNRDYATASGTALVDAEPVRQWLKDEFPDVRARIGTIALQAELPYSTVWMIVAGTRRTPPRRAIQAKIARALLSTQYDLAVVGRMGMVDATGARRRIHALMWVGWAQKAIAAETGLAPTFITSISSGNRTQISYKVHLAILRVYGRLHNVIGPSLQTRQLAIKKDYAPGIAWKHQAIHDPNAVPDWGMEVHTPVELALAQIRFMFLIGTTREMIAKIYKQDLHFVWVRTAALGIDYGRRVAS